MISLESTADHSFLLIRPDGRSTRLECDHRPSCRHLSSKPVTRGTARSGTSYKLNAQGSELEVDTWRIVKDGSRPVDRDTYVRAAPGAGFAGTWRKVHSREAPTIWRISVGKHRMTFATADGEVNFSFSLQDARMPQGACVVLSLERLNCYTILGPLQFLERSFRQGTFVAQSVGTLSRDGLSMTEEHTEAASTAKPIHIVYDRVSPSSPH